MKRAVLAVLALIVVAASGLAAMWYLQQEEARPSIGIREAAPDSLIYWVEAPDLEALWGSMQGTDALSELRASGMVEALAENFRTSTATAELRRAASKSGIEFDDDTLFQFAGQHTGLGLRPASDAAGFDALLLTRVDRLALTQELLGRQGDYLELWQELRSRSDAAGASVRTVEAPPYTLAEFTYDGASLWGVLMEDVLAIATSEQLLRDAVAVRNAEGLGSLDRLAAFGDELERLPPTPALIDWVHLAAVREQRPDVLAALRHGVGPWAQEAAGEILDDTAAAPALARSFELPGGDLYDLRWTHSREFEDLYGPRVERLPTDSVLGDRLLMLTEVHEPARMFDAFDRSPVAAHLNRVFSRGAAAEAFWGAMDESLHERLDSDGRRVLGDDGDYRASVRFLTRMGWNLTRRQVSSTLGTGAALAVGMEEDEPQVVAAARLDVAGRIAAGLFAAHALSERQVRIVDAGDLRIYVAEDATGLPGELDAAASGAAWAVHQDLFVAASSAELVARALRRQEAAAPESVQQAWTRLGGDPVVRCMLRLEPVVERMMELSPQELPEGFFDLLGDDLPDWAAMGWTVADDMSWVGMEMVHPVPPSLTAEALQDQARRSQTELAGPGLLPPDVLLASSFEADPAWFMAQLRRQLEAVDGLSGPDPEMEELLGPQEPQSSVAAMDEALDQASAELGLDLERSWLPSLHGEVAFALVYQEARRLRGMPPSAPELGVPDLLLAVRLDEIGPSEALLRGIEDWIARAMDGPRGPAPSPIRRTTLAGSDVLWFDPDPEMAESMGFTPDVTLGIVDSWLVLTGSRDTFLATAQAVRGGPSLRSSELLSSAERAGVSRAGVSLSVFSWNRTLDQLLESREALHGAVPTDVPVPEYGENDTPATWNRKLEAYQAAVEQEQRKTADEWVAMSDALRWFDVLASSQRVVDGHSHTIIGVGFTPPAE